MNRIFFSIGSFNIYWYSVLIVIGIILGIIFAGKDAEKNGLTKDYIYDLAFYLIPISIVGARIYYCLFNFSEYKNNPIEVFEIWNGGLAIYGAIIASIIFIIYYCKKKKKSILLTLDTLAIYLALGQSIGRWGNFINKEAHGSMVLLETLEKLKIPKFIIDGMYINGAYYLPTFLFESIACFIIFIILSFVKKKDKYQNKGLILYIYCILYGISRFLIEGLRTDSLYLGPFRISQIVSIILVIYGISSIVNMERKKKCKNIK